jgi:hypothetical protein
MIGPGRLSILLLLLFLTGFASPALALNFNAFWLYREAGGEDVDARREFQQNYNLGVGPTLEYRPTHAISATASLGYSRTQRDQGQDRGWETVDQISPGAQLTLANDIFMAQVAGHLTQSRTSGDAAVPTTHGWDATLASAWQIPLWPTLLFNYSERFDETEDAAGLTLVDTKDTNRGITVNWDLLLAELSYRFNRSELEDRIGGSLSTSDSHFGRVETGGKFWKERIRIDLSQQVQYTTSDLSIGALQDGIFNEALAPLETSAAVTNPDILPDPLPGQSWPDAEVGLVDNPALRNELRDDFPAPLKVDLRQRAHLGVSFSLAEQIDVLHLYLDPVTAPTGAQAGEAANLQWDLYVRVFEAGWELAAANIPATYNETEQRFELAINRLERQIMVVATNTTASTLDFTELEVFSQRTQDTASTITSYLTNASGNIQFTRTLRASTNLILEHVETESDDLVRDFDRLSVSGRLGWTPTPYLSPSLGFSQTLENQTGAPDQLNRSYSLTVTSVPLPTLSFNFGATRTDRYLGDVKTDTSNNYSLLSTAQIYPDLSAALFANYRNGESLDTSGDLTSTDSYNGRLTINARFNRALTSDLTTNYQRTESDTRETSNSDATLSLRYRPSDLLSLTATGTKFLTGPEASDILGLGMDLRFLRTAKTQATFRYNFLQAEETVNRFGLDWTWDISRALYLQTKANYSMAESDTYTIEAYLSFRL